jgi:hypothetical protein
MPTISINRLRGGRRVEEALAERVLAGEILLRHGLVDDDHRRLRRVLVRTEIPSALQPRLERRQIAGTDLTVQDFVVCAVERPAVHAHPDRVAAGERRRARHAHRTDARQAADLRFDLPEQRRLRPSHDPPLTPPRPYAEIVNTPFARAAAHDFIADCRLQIADLRTEDSRLNWSLAIELMDWRLPIGLSIGLTIVD